MDELHQQRLTLQETMNFLGALASGIEAAVGEPAKTISYLAGEKLGMRFSENAEKTDDIEKAMVEVNRILGENQCHWDFEPFQTTGCPELVQHTENGDEIMLVFRRLFTSHSRLRRFFTSSG